MLTSKKRAQLSIFVLIGAILVLVVGFLVANGDFELFQTYDTRLKNQVSDVVKGCMVTHADAGLFLLGFQGGVIEVPLEKEIDPSKHIDFGLKIPNWDTQRGDIPSIPSMELELEAYVEEQVLSCVTSNLQALASALEITVADEATVDASIEREHVALEMELPITFKEANSPEELSVSDYFVKIDDLRLGDLFELAQQIYTLEQQELFVEDLVLDQIFSSGDYSSPLSMPSQGMIFSCAQRVWTYDQLKENVANLNNNNFKYLQLEGTYPIDSLFDVNFDGENAPVDYRNYYEEHYAFELPNKRSTFKNYKVNMFMPSTEITGDEGITQRYPYRTFEVNPDSGEFVRSIKMKVGNDFKIPLPCIQVFHHTYTLDYDLIIQLVDLTDDGQEYIFQFPLRVEIDQNTPKERAPATFLTQEPLTATNDVFCSEDAKEYPMQIFAIDTYGNYLKNVNVSYRCINLQCEMGTTQKPTFRGVERTAAEPLFEGDFPYCVGGEVIVESEGYHPGKQRVDTDESIFERENVLFYDIEMIPLKEFEIDESTFLLVDRDTRLGQRVFTEEDGSIYVSVESQAYEFSESAIWPSSADFVQSLSFLDTDETVKYNISALYMSADYELLGMLELKDVEVEIHRGNVLEFVIPSSSTEIDPDSYEEFYSFMELAVDSGQYGLNVR